MADAPASPNHAFSLGATTGTFPCATQWLLLVGPGTALSITTPGGETVALGAVPAGMWPIRATAVTVATAYTAITGFWT